ncbi:MAG: hypothetical protein LUC92_02820, partial [Clostridiales bacterium]|nr:hypothetical protein [Clostridiales bacterium]
PESKRVILFKKVIDRLLIINSVSYRDGSLYKTTTTNLKRYYEIINQMYGEIYHVESNGGYGYCIEK